MDSEHRTFSFSNPFSQNPSDPELLTSGLFFLLTTPQLTDFFASRAVEGFFLSMQNTLQLLESVELQYFDSLFKMHKVALNFTSYSPEVLDPLFDPIRKYIPEAGQDNPYVLLRALYAVFKKWSGFQDYTECFSVEALEGLLDKHFTTGVCSKDKYADFIKDRIAFEIFYLIHILATTEESFLDWNNPKEFRLKKMFDDTSDLTSEKLKELSFGYLKENALSQFIKLFKQSSIDYRLLSAPFRNLRYLVFKIEELIRNYEKKIKPAATPFDEVSSNDLHLSFLPFSSNLSSSFERPFGEELTKLKLSYLQMPNIVSAASSQRTITFLLKHRGDVQRTILFNPEKCPVWKDLLTPCFQDLGLNMDEWHSNPPNFKTFVWAPMDGIFDLGNNFFRNSREFEKAQYFIVERNVNYVPILVFDSEDSFRMFYLHKEEQISFFLKKCLCPIMRTREGKEFEPNMLKTDLKYWKKEVSSFLTTSLLNMETRMELLKYTASKTTDVLVLKVDLKGCIYMQDCSKKTISTIPVSFEQKLQHSVSNTEGMGGKAPPTPLSDVIIDSDYLIMNLENEDINDYLKLNSFKMVSSKKARFELRISFYIGLNRFKNPMLVLKDRDFFKGLEFAESIELIAKYPNGKGQEKITSDTLIYNKCKLKYMILRVIPLK